MSINVITNIIWYCFSVVTRKLEAIDNGPNNKKSIQGTVFRIFIRLAISIGDEEEEYYSPKDVPHLT